MRFHCTSYDAHFFVSAFSLHSDDHLLCQNCHLSLLTMKSSSLLYILLALSVGRNSSFSPSKMSRKIFLKKLAALSLLSWLPAPTTSLVVQPAKASIASPPIFNGKVTDTIAYKQMSFPMNKFPGVNVPVACWFPTDTTKVSPASYQHRISVRRIGQLLAGWEFIPEFASKGYDMAPTSMTSRIVDGRDVSLPTFGPVVLLAHGYLGSRFDLSHLAEELASQGFVCIAAEYPESLAASYDQLPGLDRRAINDVLLKTMENDWGIKASSYGIVGHSLGCGTVQQTGDESWARVSIAGFPRNRDGTPIKSNGLFLMSMGDGAVSLARYGGANLIAECGYEMLQQTGNLEKLPKRAALVFDGPGAPNHISFLSEGVNDAMTNLLSPLLPVAQAMKIPVLDFDRYKVSRDSKATAEIVHPLIVQYLKQEMLVQG